MGCDCEIEPEDGDQAVFVSSERQDRKKLRQEYQHNKPINRLTWSQLQVVDSVSRSQSHLPVIAILTGEMT